MSDESRRKKAYLYQLVTMANYYIPDERMMVVEDGNGGSYRNQ